MKRWAIRGLIAGVLLAVVAGFLTLYFLGSIVKKGVESAGPDITKTSVNLDSAKLSVFSGNGELKGFVIGNPAGFKSPFAVRAEAINVSLDPRSVFADKVIVRSVKVLGPEVTFDGTLTGNNLATILKNIRGPEPTQTASSTKKLQVDDFLITGGKIHLQTSLLGGQSATLVLPEIHLTNLGQGHEGITATELSDRIFRILVEETMKQVAQSSVGKTFEGLKKIPGAAADPVNKLKRGVDDLFRKP